MSNGKPTFTLKEERMNSSNMLKQIIVMTNRGEYQDALKLVEFLDTSSLNPDELVQYLFYKGSLLYSVERIIEAFDCIREAKRLRPGDKDISSTLDLFTRTEIALYKKKFKVRFDWM